MIRRLRDRLRKPPQRAQVRHCDDPRNRSGGRGGNHRVVLLRLLPDGRWLCAVIESNPPTPVFVFDSPRIAGTAGVAVGSAVRPPVAKVAEDRLGDKAGAVSEITCIKIEVALAAAEDTA